MKNFLLKETNLKLAKVLNLVDSSTVLGYLYKGTTLQGSNFCQFEGSKIAKIKLIIYGSNMVSLLHEDEFQEVKIQRIGVLSHPPQEK